MLVAIRHKLNDPLAVMLSILQPQLSGDDDIYVIDTTPTREGWEIVKKYATSRCVVYCEVGEYDKDTSDTLFKQRAIRNGHRNILYLDNVLFSTTFISNIKKANSINDFEIIVPDILPNGELLNPNFKWYNQPTKEVNRCNDYTDRCYLRSFTGEGIGKINNEKIILL